MKILWLSHFVPYPPKGGNLQRSYNLIRELARRHEVHLFAFNKKAFLSTQAELEASREALSRICAHVTIVESPHERSAWAHNLALLRNVLSSDPYSVQLLASSEMREALNQFLRDQPVDVFHADAIELAPYASCAGSATKVLNHHNVESELLFRRATAMRNPATRSYVHLQASKLHRYEDRMIGGFHTNLTVSERDRDILLQRVPTARADVISNGVDTEYFRPSDGESAENSLIFVGGLTWFPNADAVAYFSESIWPLIRARLPNARLTLVGRMPGDFDTSKLPAGIEARGFVDDIRPLVANASAFIVPLRVGGGTRLKILDALASGKAIVSTSIGCEGIDVTPGENILVGDTPEEFTDQVVRVCEDPSLRNKLGEAGRRVAEEKYSWNLIGSQLSELLQSLQG